jgi:hypothetical protein
MTTVVKVSSPSKTGRSSILKRVSAWLHGPTLVRDLAVIVAIKFVI